MMTQSEVSNEGMENLSTRSKAKQNYRILHLVQVGCKAKYRLEQKEGYGQHALFWFPAFWHGTTT